ncbi:unnamed protein product, partial [Cyprideis torosa]
EAHSPSTPVQVTTVSVEKAVLPSKENPQTLVIGETGADTTYNGEETLSDAGEASHSQRGDFSTTEELSSRAEGSSEKKKKKKKGLRTPSFLKKKSKKKSSTPTTE